MSSFVGKQSLDLIQLDDFFFGIVLGILDYSRNLQYAQHCNPSLAVLNSAMAGLVGSGNANDSNPLVS
jgi:hypothetical protein